MYDRHVDIIKFYIKHGKAATVNKFYGIYYCKRQLYRIIEIFENTGCFRRKQGSGRKASTLPVIKRNKLLGECVNKIGKSVRGIARKYRISKS